MQNDRDDVGVRWLKSHSAGTKAKVQTTPCTGTRVIKVTSAYVMAVASHTQMRIRFIKLVPYTQVNLLLLYSVSNFSSIKAKNHHISSLLSFTLPIILTKLPPV